MNPWQKTVNKFRKAIMGSSHNFVGAESFSTWNPGYSLLNHYTSDAYASSYPSIRAIANEYMTIQPHAIDANGKPVRHSAVDALYHPNQTDSSVAFFEKIAVSTLVLRKTYILVWRREGVSAEPGGDFTHDTIAGFTFLEQPGISRRDGKTFYNIGSQYFTEKEVMVLPGGVDPHNLYGGYSPTEAARRWATLDDYIADYQKGFFENGAVPAGMFKIAAPSKKEYEDIVLALQQRHRGAGNNGNVSYSHQPIDPTTGKLAEAKIEWVPFSQNNKDIDFKNLFEQTNHRIDVAYGVPQIVKGVDDAATYANAQVAEKTFAKRAVYPLALRNYTQITHELNRITNGLGVAITFDYEIPTVADEEKVEAETKTLEAGVIKSMVEAGYSLDSIVDAFKLSTSYKLLKAGDGKTKIDNDKPDVDEGNEVIKSPDPDKVDGVSPLNKAGSKRPKAKKDEDDDYQTQMYTVAARYMEAQIDSAIEDYRKEAEPSNVVTGAQKPVDEDKFVDELMDIIRLIMLVEGPAAYDIGTKLLEDAGKATDNLNGFNFSDTADTAYQMYVRRVGESYGADTAVSIRNILALADRDGWTRVEIEEGLRNIMDTDEWRITRLATSELNRSLSLSSVEAMKQIKTESGIELEKSLQHLGSEEPCEFCAVLVDNWVAVDQLMVPKDSVVVGVDGGQLINKFADNDGYDPHPNGHCRPEYRIKPENVQNSVGPVSPKMDGVRCKHCDRYLFTATDTVILEQMPCPNTKCKAKLNIKVVTSASTPEQLNYKFKTQEEHPKSKEIKV